MIDRLLAFDPSQRITTKEALTHPWINVSKEAGLRTSTNLAPSIRKGFSSRGSFTAIALQEEQVKRLDIPN